MLRGREPRRPRGGRLGKPASRLPQEERVAKKLPWRRQPGSGNQPGKKGDFEDPRPESVVGEGKTTEGRVIVVEMSWVRKIWREATEMRKKPILVLGFENMPPPVEEDWGAMPMSVVRALTEAAGWDLEIKEA